MALFDPTCREALYETVHDALAICLAASGSKIGAVETTGGNHMIMGFAPPNLHFTDSLNIFIEGDGKPGIGLDLARSTGGNSVYLARPCDSRFNSCGKAVWTSHRYSQTVIDSMGPAIAQ